LRSPATLVKQLAACVDWNKLNMHFRELSQLTIFRIHASTANFAATTHQFLL
jgi:hypothetical protein